MRDDWKIRWIVGVHQREIVLWTACVDLLVSKVYILMFTKYYNHKHVNLLIILFQKTINILLILTKILNNNWNTNMLPTKNMLIMCNECELKLIQIELLIHTIVSNQKNILSLQSLVLVAFENVRPRQISQQFTHTHTRSPSNSSRCNWINYW
jgi:hypothetical protein